MNMKYLTIPKWSAALTHFTISLGPTQSPAACILSASCVVAPPGKYTLPSTNFYFLTIVICFQIVESNSRFANNALRNCHIR